MGEVTKFAQKWAAGGAEKTAQLLREYCKAERPVSEGPDPLKVLLHELVSIVIAGGLEASKFRELLANQSVVSLSQLPRIQSDLADVFWFIGLELEADEARAGTERKPLLNLVRELLRTELMPAKLVKARLDPDVLQAVGVIKDEKEFHKGQVRLNTRALYTQQKYNLFREESEGYSKLITELSELPAAHGEETSTRRCKQAAEVITNIQSLIGYFDLDPNRVLDLVLEALEAVPSRVAHRSLVSLFNPNYIPHMLGFKFQYYHKAQLPTPNSLYQLCGVLLQQGIIWLEQVLPHLAPTIAEMQQEYQEGVEKALAEAKRIGMVNLGGGGDGGGGGGRRSLADAGSLDGDDPPPARSGTAPESSKPAAEPEASTALPFERMQPLGVLRAVIKLRDWRTAELLMDALGEIEAARCPPLRDAMCDLLEWLTAPAYERISPQAILQRSAKTDAAPASAAPAEADATEAADVVPEADDTSAVQNGIDKAAPLTQAKTPQQAVVMVLPVVVRIGLHVWARPLLLARLCRLCAAAIQAAADDKVARDAVEGICEHCLMPALTVSPPNPGLVHELWQLLERLDYTARYRLYGLMHERLKEGTVPELALARATTADETKRMMRRLSKENTKQYGRHLGKITHSNPSVVFDTILSQIQAYDNLIVPVVDMMKYITPMSFDFLTYMLLSHLASPSKTRLKDDGLNVSLWMQSLSSFCGNLYKKYPLIELVGLLQYITNTLKSGMSLQLLVLRDLVTKMAGIDMLEDLSADQLEAQAGGETLRSCVTDLLGIARNTKKSSTRLKEALVKNGLVAPLFLLIAQQRSACVFLNDSQHLKQLGELYDRCQETLEQFQAFIASTVSPAEYARILPTVGELVSLYGLEPEAAFFIARPVIAFQESMPPGKDEEEMSTEQRIEKVQRIRDVLPADTWTHISPQLYTTFWSLSLYDIYVPKERYHAEVKRLRRQIEEIDRWVPPIGGEPDPKGAATRRRKDKERFAANIEKLKAELVAQEARHKEVMARVKESCKHWFPESKGAAAETMMQFLHHCVWPRCVFTPADAIYCAKFAYLTHVQSTPNFSSLQYYAQLMKNLSVRIFSCTEQQAANLGRFLNASFEILLHWKSDEEIYKEECGKSPGFKTAKFEDFVRVMFMWYCKMLKFVNHCLESKEYMEVRNALHVLTRIVDVFPAMKKLCEHVERRVTKLKDEERKDLQVLASQYFAQLQKIKPKLQTQDEFCKGFAVKDPDRPTKPEQGGKKPGGSSGDKLASAEAPADGATSNSSAKPGALKEEPVASEADSKEKHVTEDGVARPSSEKTSKARSTADADVKKPEPEAEARTKRPPASAAAASGKHSRDAEIDKLPPTKQPKLGDASSSSTPTSGSKPLNPNAPPFTPEGAPPLPRSGDRKREREAAPAAAAAEPKRRRDDDEVRDRRASRDANGAEADKESARGSSKGGASDKERSGSHRDHDAESKERSKERESKAGASERDRSKEREAKASASDRGRNDDRESRGGGSERDYGKDSHSRGGVSDRERSKEGSDRERSKEGSDRERNKEVSDRDRNKEMQDRDRSKEREVKGAAASERDRGKEESKAGAMPPLSGQPGSRLPPERRDREVARDHGREHARDPRDSREAREREQREREQREREQDERLKALRDKAMRAERPREPDGRERDSARRQGQAAPPGDERRRVADRLGERSSKEERKRR